MNAEVQQHIHKFLFNLSNQDYSKANENIKAAVDAKMKIRLEQAERELIKKK